MSNKPRKAKKFNPVKHYDPKGGKSNSQMYDLDIADFTQIVALENIARSAKEAQTHYFIKLADQRWGYEKGTILNFDMDWKNAKVRVTMVGKATKATNQAKESDDGSGKDKQE